MNSKLMASAALAVFLGFAGSSPASAATSYSSCPANLLDNVVSNQGCEVSSAEQDFLNTDPITVNEDGGFFDINTWKFLTKDESSTGTGLSGTFDISSLGIDVATTGVLMVFKDGKGTSLVGYLLSSLTGTWTSPFENPPFDIKEIKNVSHISFYTSDDAPPVDPDPDPVPLPAPLLLLLSGLGGMGVLARMRRKA